jgi:aminoglycoside 2''-phosphotransferase
LTALHRFPLQEALAAGIAEGSPARWRAQYQAFYQRVRGRVFPLLRAEEQRTVAAIWEAFLEDEANFCFYPVLIHRDLCGEHILYDAQRRTITGIIDWEDAGIGDPAQDFTGLLANFGPEFEAQVLAAYGGPPDARLLSRTRFYRAVVPFHEVLYGLDAGLPEHISTGVSDLRATLATGAD